MSTAPTLVVADQEELASRFASAIAEAALAIPSGTQMADHAEVTLRRLQALDPAGFEAWVQMHIVTFAADAMRKVIHSSRSRVVAQRQRQRFMDALAAENPVFAMRLCLENDIYKPLGELTGVDLDFVIRSYLDRAEANSVKALRFQALRDRVADTQTVASALSADEVASLLGVTN